MSKSRHRLWRAGGGGEERGFSKKALFVKTRAQPTQPTNTHGRVVVDDVSLRTVMSYDIVVAVVVQMLTPPPS